MGLDNTFCQLGRFLDGWGREEVTVETVTVSDCDRSQGDLTVEVKASFPVGTVGTASEDTTVTTCSADVSSDGTLELRLETDLETPSTADGDIEIEPVDAAFDPDGTVLVTFSGTVTTSGDDTRSTGEAHSGEEGAHTASGNRVKPPFRNPELLQEIYDSHDTFAEMSEALEMDVTGETVRRYMIDYDIHQPESYAKNGQSEETTTANGPLEGDIEETIVLPDGIGLPEDTTVEELTETVNNSNTIHEVKQKLEMERTEAHEMLKELDLVSAVMGRLSNGGGHEMRREEISERLRKVSRQQ